jgi:cell fate (sporulation/competence/biofilm development) regulator YlbF (YheA/YmcA/DUF963 family)
MLTSSRKILTAVVVAGLTTAATVAIAQQAAPPVAGPEKQGPWAGHEHHHMMPSQLVEARLAYMKTALQITPAQSTQWNALADVLRKQAKARDEKFTEMHQKMESMKAGGDTRPDPITMMEHRQKMMTDAAANMAEFIAAAKPLYASFSDSQKEIAGEVLGHHGHGGMHGGWGHGGEK